MGLLLDHPVGFVVAGAASAVPRSVRRPDGTTVAKVHNEDIYRIVYGEGFREHLAREGKNEEHPETFVGVRERSWTHWVGGPPSPDECTSADLCEEAAAAAMERAGVKPGEVDLFICTSTTAPRWTASISAIVGGKLGILAPCFDLKAGCSSGVYALLTAAQFIAGGAKTVVVACGETLSKTCNPKLPQTAFTVGDGAASVVLKKSDDAGRGLLAGFFDADGRYASAVTTIGRLPPTAEAIEKGEYFFTGDATILREVVPQKWPIAVGRVLEAAKLSPRDLDLYVPHQVNKALIEMSAMALEIPPERTYLNIDRRANVGGASVLLALSDALEEGRATEGMTVAMNVVGGGLTWAAALLRL